ncbi:MAG: ribonuclease HII [Bacteroidota bacterium]|nr:ribonuclease HII [Candidatus Kapabacteria bacterium]MCS7302134.1 ribonuclease HII [Candidatus Kapabacteria bacterium]MCX7936437.1 ribonuclease HII [Chlorobiota bacterium]MDW8074283.1 ribonuclease HII [Bacteroidota bacterium]MDW8271241.1 ribonuclease HII [Bacteroidota bacterium]
MASTTLEQPFWKVGKLVAGVDEAGRGCLAGPVVAAAVVLSPDSRHLCRQVQDSKQLSPAAREKLYDDITSQALAWGVGIADVAMIDRQNIFRATLYAMQQAVNALTVRVDHVFVDGPHLPPDFMEATPVVGGDVRSASIAAASIVAKVTRDRIMIALAAEYPHFGFDRHKGYPTAEHYRCLDRWGPTPVHRKSFLGKWHTRTRQQQAL